MAFGIGRALKKVGRKIEKAAKKTVAYITGKNREDDKKNSSTRDYRTTLKVSAASVRRVYGKSAGGGLLSFIEEEQSTSAKQRINLCVVTCGHEIESLDTIWFGDKVAYTTNPNRETSTDLYSQAKRGFKDYTNFILYDDPTIVSIQDYDALYGFPEALTKSNVFCHIRYTDSQGNPAIKSANVKGYTFNYFYVTITFDSPIPKTTTAISIGESTFSFWSVNNPKTINDVPEEWRKNASQWKSDMIGQGLHYVLFEMKYDDKVFSSGLPEFKFERKGVKLYNPLKDGSRLGTGSHRLDKPSTWEWSDNAALAILDIHTQVYGYELDEIDEQSFCDAVIACEGLFKINGEFDFEESYSDVVGSMLEACAGKITTVAGRIGLKVGAYQGKPTLTINDNSLISDVSIQAETPYKDRFNMVNPKYREPLDDYADTEAEAITDSRIIVQDGRKIPKRLDVTKWVTSKWQAEYLSWIMLRKGRNSMSVSGKCDMAMVEAISGKPIEFDFKAIGLNDEFLCEEMDFSLDSGVGISLIKEDESFYDTNFNFNPPTRSALVREIEPIPVPKNVVFKSPVDASNQGQVTWDEESLYPFRVDLYNDREQLLYTLTTREPIIQLTGLAFKPHHIFIYCLTTLGRSGSAATLTFTPEKPPIQLYTWVVFADDEHGHGISTIPDGKTYIGFAYNKETPTPNISDPSVYMWSKFVGEDGSGVRIMGSMPLNEIVKITNAKVGDTYISTTSGTTPPPDNKKVFGGDGITWTEGHYWTNVGAVKGKDGIDGKTSRTVYRKGKTKPSKPSGAAIPPQGWSINPIVDVPEGEFVWFSKTWSVSEGATVGDQTWTEPALFTRNPNDGEDGTDGKDGQTIWIEFQFSPDGINWHFPEREGDIYLRSRKVTDGQAGEWGGKTNLKGSSGESGSDGKTYYTWVKYADSASGAGISDKPDGKAYIGIAYNKETDTESNNPNDYEWSLIKGADGKDGQKGDKGEDGAKGEKGDDGQKGDKGEKGDDGQKGDKGEDGKDGKDGEYAEYWYKEAIEFTDLELPKRYPPDSEGWLKHPIPEDELKAYLFMTSIMINPATKQPAIGAAWTTIVRLTGTKGIDGQDGKDGSNGQSGNRGTVNIVDKAVRQSWSNSAAYQSIMLLNLSLPREPIPWDVVTQSDAAFDSQGNKTGGSWSETRRYIRGGANNSEWERVDKIYDGALIVNGSIKGESINASTRITVGTGNNIAVISGESDKPTGLNYRFWAGSKDPTSSEARTSISDTGVLTTKDAILGGRLQAASGTFTGDLVAASGTFKGTVYADNIEGDVMKYLKSNEITSFYYKYNPGNNPDIFRVLWDRVVGGNETKVLSDSIIEDGVVTGVKPIEYLTVEPKTFDRRAVCMDSMTMMVETGGEFNPKDCDISITVELVEIKETNLGNTMMRFTWTNAPWTITRMIGENGIKPLAQIAANQSYFVKLTPKNDGEIRKSSTGKYALRIRVASYKRWKDGREERIKAIGGVRVYQVGSDESAVQLLLEKKN